MTTGSSSTYEAGGAYVVAEGEGELRAALDGDSPTTHSPSRAGLIAVAEHPRHERHTLALEVAPGVRIWAVSFAPGMP